MIGFKNFAEKATDKYPQIVDWIGLFNTNIGIIISILLVVVIINIIMVLLILIIERTNSIGVLKTFGCYKRTNTSCFYQLYTIDYDSRFNYRKRNRIRLATFAKVFGIIKLNPENYYVSTVPVDLNPIYILAISVGILIISAIALILPAIWFLKYLQLR